MMNDIEVKINRKKLITSIHFNIDDSTLINKIKFALSSHSNDLIIDNKSIQIPWYDFVKLIKNFSYIVKKEKAKVIFDALSKELISKYLDDIKQANEIIPKRSEEKLINYCPKLKIIGFNRKLTEQQNRDLNHLLDLKHGANFSVPGAGKTTTILAIYSILKHENKVNKLFVVAPMNAFISWEDEIGEIFGEEKISIYRLSTKDVSDIGKFNKDFHEIYLINYEKLRRDINGLLPIFLNNKVHLVLDESHRIKSGWKNLSFQQIIKLSDIAERRDILSGTPMPQHFSDLYSQFEFLWRKNLLEEYELIESDEYTLEKIQKQIGSKFVRTTKKELGLQDPVIKYTKIELGPIQRELYDLISNETARILARLDFQTKSEFRRIGRSVVNLLQAATNPMLLGVENEYFEEVLEIPINSEIWELLKEFSKYEKPQKIEYLVNKTKEIINENQNNKIVIWSYFVRNIQLLEKLLHSFNPVSIYGNVPTGDDENEKNREFRIRKFHNDPSCKILIGNPQACGEGISLHRASHYAIYLDRNFNAAYFLQSIDRIHRLGLAKDITTNIEILVANNTIDEVLIERINKKSEAMGIVLNDPYLRTLAYDPEDILDDDKLGLDLEDIRAIYKQISK